MAKILAQNDKNPLDVWKEQGFIWHTSGKGDKHRLNYSFFEDSENLDGYKAAGMISIPTLIIHGDADDVVPIEQSKKTLALIKDCKLEIIQGAGHDFSKENDFNKVMDYAVGFILTHS